MRGGRMLGGPWVRLECRAPPGCNDRAMQENKRQLSQTMRIDLIPDVPAEPASGREKRYIVSALPPTGPAPERKAGPAQERGAASAYELLLESLYDAVLITDLSGRVLEGNARAQDFLHYDRVELRHITIFDVILGTDDSLIQTLLANLANERYTLIQAYCLRKDGSHFPSEIAVSQLRLTSPRLCFFIRDITLRRQAEEMLRTEHNAIQNAGNGIAIANIFHELEYVNPATARMWRYDKPQDLVGKPVVELWTDTQAAEAMVQALLSPKRVWKGELKAKGRDGTLFDVQVSAALNRNSDGEPVGSIFSFVDITDRKRAEEAEREAERRRVMLESLGAACHHLGQPATVLLANLGIMKKKLDTQAEPLVRELLDGSIRAMETLGEILHKLNAVEEYKTTKYLEGPDGTVQSRILEI